MSAIPPHNVNPVISEKVKGPATALMIIAIIGIVFQLLGMILNLAGAGMGAASAGDSAEGMGMMMQGAMGVMINIISIIGGGFIVFGSMKMKALDNYAIAMAASIIAMIPCLSSCCILGIPIGIWSIVVLQDPDVKAAFEGDMGGGMGAVDAQAAPPPVDNDNIPPTVDQ